MNRRAAPGDVYPTAAKATIKGLTMFIEFILITTVWVSYQNRCPGIPPWQLVGAPVLQECTCPSTPMTVDSTQLYLLGQCDTAGPVWHTCISQKPSQLVVGPLEKRSSSQLSPKGGPGSYKTHFLSSVPQMQFFPWSHGQKTWCSLSQGQGKWLCWTLAHA